MNANLARNSHSDQSISQCYNPKKLVPDSKSIINVCFR